ncbi:MAG: DnaJ domain-containing protein [Desulfobacterales bacterium]|nr:DnaJ domain-containing protein [Desulfobacterales bacterium]
MITAYLILGVSLDATNEEIRKRYLQLVKEFTPEKYPEKFQEISNAYESIKNEQHRVELMMFGSYKQTDVETTFMTIANALQINKKRVGLKELLEAEKKYSKG